ncbi:hydantoinase/oxoprolinase family protein [Salipiger sp. P9]|uniref:hydantoinase/oxoprolinase family protein n=1 Tax=Salipiger pentaromativorans TaxID=2943193 RepID=UPI0021571FC8|nr:hydantoinase/oxoprolinase family protein [Salipiger pentaromativorans]MCR8547819.1 hydantoinase/oxoprolinase family protein [Salipiger pentaromativorans]
MRIDIAVDVGGTFTDLILRESGGRVRSYKAPTTPGSIVDGILDGLTLIAQSYGIDRPALLARCDKIACGTTVATNAILEGTYARTGLLCTEGFRDTLLIREGGKDGPDAIRIAMDYPEPYIPRHLTFGIRERIDSDGGVVTELDEGSVLDAIERLKAQKVEAIAVCLLWSIANPAHERRIGELLDAHCPEIPYSLSHYTCPTLREYRRSSTTAIDASLKPVVRRAVSELEGKLREAGLQGLLTLVTSSGGQTSLQEAMERPVALCLSGPSAAPEAARTSIAAQGAESCNAIVVDMGGTSFDISIVNDWDISMHREGIIAGNAFSIPAVEVNTIGSGGGSLATVDAGGLIHVGPKSAKSYPGPACYGRGGTHATVTDANLVRGFLDPESFASGTMTLSPGNAEAAIKADVADPLGLGTEEAASLIGFTVEQDMVAAIEEFTVRRGIDPREYVMVVGGAAAGLHAVPIARELGMKTVLVPATAGVLSASGILVSDIKSSFSQSQYTTSETFDFDSVNAILSSLEARAAEYLTGMNVAPADREMQFTAEARYRGQVWQLTLPLDGARIEGEEMLEALVERFHKLHEKTYFVRGTDAIEFTEWSVAAIGRLKTGPLDHGTAREADLAGHSKGVRQVYIRELGGQIEVPVYDGSKLVPGTRVAGPAIIDQPLTSIVLYADTMAEMADNGTVEITVG